MKDRPVTQEQWSSWLGDMPMPESATHEMLMAARDALQAIEEKEEDFRLLEWYQEDKKRYEERLEWWKTQTHEPDYYKRLGHIENILKLIDEGIELLRERLIE